MKIFTILLGYLAVARFDHTVFGSPAGVVAGRKGDIMQQYNDAFTSGQALETRQGDPALFPLAVSLIVSAIGLDVQGKKGSNDDEALRLEFIERVTGDCATYWSMWNWAVVVSDNVHVTYNIYSMLWGWYEYPLKIHGSYNYTVLWFQGARLSIMQNLGSTGWAYENTSYEYNTATTPLNETDIDFHAPDPGIIIEKGIKDDVDRMVEEIANAVVNLIGDKKRESFTAWVVGNGSQQWSEFSWVVESNPHFIRPNGLVGTDWGVSLYEVFIESPPVEFYVYWLKSGRVINEGERGYRYWAWASSAAQHEMTYLPSQFKTTESNTVSFNAPLP